jgi:peptidoglycan/LPS O-acetylase OafA/YrhL
MKLKSLEILNSPARTSSVDVFRAFAIIPVVLYHFNGSLPYGYLGVDLFFVISGLLVGSILIRQFKRNEEINFARFILQRGFKIWPSYYSFLLLGTLLAFIFFREDQPEYIIGGGGDIFKYIFFYQNYSGFPYHWPFSHVWSLCVEEHFYILLPLLFLFIKVIFKNNRNFLILGVACLILTGIIFKFLSTVFTPGVNVYATTHNRIDGLAWGVLLGILVVYFEEDIRKIKWINLLFFLGIILLTAGLFIVIEDKDRHFEQNIFYSLSPFCFFLMLLGVYYHDFSKWKPLRFIAYYSYNWYLWHPLAAVIVIKQFGVGIPSLLTYLVISFLTAVFFTILVEERFLMIREKLLPRFFGKIKK